MVVTPLKTPSAAFRAATPVRRVALRSAVIKLPGFFGVPLAHFSFELAGDELCKLIARQHILSAEVQPH